MEDLVTDQAKITQRQEERDSCEIEASLFILPNVCIPCVITDLSPNGAKLKLDPAVELPTHIVLLMPDIGDFTDRRHCELRWRIGDVVGLKFVTPDQETMGRPAEEDAAAAQ